MDALLQTGAAGLRYFELYLPRAAAVAAGRGTGDTFPAYPDVETRYFEQRGIDLTALDADIEILARVAAELDDRFDDEAAIRGELGQAWTGGAADRAGEHFAEHLRRADGVRRSAHAVRGALADAAGSLRAAGTRKADEVGALDPTTAGGLTPEQIDGVLAGGDCDDSSIGPFLAHVRETVQQFTTLCDETAAAIDEVYRTLDCVFAGIDDSAFPVPAPIVVECRPVAARPACTQPAAPESVQPTTSLSGLGAAGSAIVTPAVVTAPVTTPAPTPPTAPVTTAAAGSGASIGSSLSLDAAVAAGAMRAVGAVVGVVADVALGIVDAVRVDGDGDCTPDLETEPPSSCGCECACECGSKPQECPPEPAPEPVPPTPEEPVAEEPAPEEPVAAAPIEAEPAGECPEPTPEPEPVPVPEPEPAPAPEVAAPAAPPSDYCVPDPAAPEAPVTPQVAPSAHRAVGGRPMPTAGAGGEEPALAEVGPASSDADGAAALAEAGPM